MKKVALVTYSEHPELTDDDAMLVAPLARHNIESVAVPWDAEGVDWHGFDSIVVRSTWNYTYKFEEFTRWLTQMKQASLPLVNSYETMIWNANKRYLVELQEKGQPIIPSRVVESGSQARLEEIMKEEGWNEVVFKPVISASAYHTHKSTLKDAAVNQAHFDEALAHSAVLVQPFEEAICKEGEWSLIFFNHQFSHAVLKVPKSGDFRTQPHLGGKIQPIEAPARLVQDAERLLSSLPEPVLYARVDGVNKEGQLVLMELELIEPALFMFADTKSPEKMADAIHEKILA